MMCWGKLLQAIAAANSGAGSGVGTGAGAQPASEAPKQAEVIPFPSELMQLEPVEDRSGAVPLASADFALAVQMLTRFGATSRQPEAAALVHEIQALVVNAQ